MVINGSRSSGWKVVPHYGSNLHFPDDDGLEHHFHLPTLGLPYIFFCEGSVPLFDALKKIGSVVLLLLSCKSSLCVLETSSMSDKYTVHGLSGLLAFFIFLMVFFFKRSS